MKYIILGKVVPVKRIVGRGYEYNPVLMNITFNTAKEVESYIKKHASDVFLDIEIDSVVKEIDVCGTSYPASYVMRKLEPKAYKELFKGLLNDLNIAYEIEKLLDSEAIEICGFVIGVKK